MSDFDYINRTYGLSLERGTRVRYTGGRGSRIGSVSCSDGQHIRILFDDCEEDEGPFHPTWELDVIAKPEPANNG
jgi:hypothetical protein